MQTATFDTISVQGCYMHNW